MMLNNIYNYGKKIKYFVFVFIFFNGMSFFYSYIISLSYKKAGIRAGSFNIDESIERKVFIKRLKSKVSSDSIKINNFEAFIEKGYRYGQKSTSTTDSLGKNEYKFQLVLSCDIVEKYGDVFVRYENDIDDLRGFKVQKNDHLKDTLFFDVYKFQSGLNDLIGQVKVWEDNDSSLAH